MRSPIPAWSVPIASWLVAVAWAPDGSPAAALDDTPPARVAQVQPETPRPGDQGPGANDQALEPCGEADAYDARQDGAVVTITARGSHRTAGFRVVLQQSPLRIFPPQFVLKHDPPDGPVVQVITPFRVRATFRASGQEIRAVIVHDAEGRHEVKVGRGRPAPGGKQRPSGS